MGQLLTTLWQCLPSLQLNGVEKCECAPQNQFLVPRQSFSFKGIQKKVHGSPEILAGGAQKGAGLEKGQMTLQYLTGSKLGLSDVSSDFDVHQLVVFLCVQDAGLEPQQVPHIYLHHGGGTWGSKWRSKSHFVTTSDGFIEFYGKTFTLKMKGYMMERTFRIEIMIKTANFARTSEV